ncbi:phosphatidate cytidylyltransferase [Candidatus Comchoanobacter bicostacola]|uniref:Phosphatidate cytidylyltransferase n=1 Tax=Candidatus Comchoanobacter bicostacola TaxID=2919598 RepID=A0ABY5DL35_9GAMM|nr:phosphatidate cytidylyltransferase [Candidatus Comchoanobacter bicostacola]UTC24662.1 phosphatidate cytidylyltransferase [Candidatus Comchoanobacter bicostacola]
MLYKRVLSSLGIILFGACLFVLPEAYSQAFIWALCLGLVYENVKLATGITYAVAISAIFVVATAILQYSHDFYYYAVAMMYLSLLARVFCMYKDIRSPFFFLASASLDIAVFTYTVIVMLLTNKVLLFSSILLISGIDISGYFGGKFFGKKRVVPTISPNKTEAGYLSALLWMGVCAFILMIWQDLSIMLLTLNLLVVYILAIAGDLAMSFQKRVAGVKDTGSILPGHGGLLDRVDSWMTTLPYLFIWISIN